MSAWRDRAACLDEDPGLFHPPAGIASPSLAVRRATYAPAKAICNGGDGETACPECLRTAARTSQERRAART